MEDKKNRILDVLSKIANLQFQKEVWFKQLYWDEILNYSEAINTLDDYCFFDDVEVGKISLIDTLNQKKLNHFVNELLAYNEPNVAIELLIDPKWLQISKQAKEIEELLQKESF